MNLIYPKFSYKCWWVEKTIDDTGISILPYQENCIMKTSSWLSSLGYSHKYLRKPRRTEYRKQLWCANMAQISKQLSRTGSVLGGKIDKKFPKQAQFTTQREKEKKKKCCSWAKTNIWSAGTSSIAFFNNLQMNIWSQGCYQGRFLLDYHANRYWLIN